MSKAFQRSKKAIPVAAAALCIALNGCFFLFPLSFIAGAPKFPIWPVSGKRPAFLPYYLFLIPPFYISVLYGYIDSAVLLPCFLLTFIAAGVVWVMGLGKCLLIVRLILLTLILRHISAMKDRILSGVQKSYSK